MAPSTSRNILAPSSRTASLTVVKWFRQPKQNVPCRPCGQRADGVVRDERVVAPESIGKADRPLRVDGRVDARGIEERIGDPIVHRREARRSRIGEPAHLNRRRLLGKRAGADCASCASARSTQDIEAVVADARRDLDVAPVGDEARSIGVPEEVSGPGVRDKHVRVAKYLEPLVIVMTEKRVEEHCRCVLAELVGNVSDAQPTIARAIVLVGALEARERPGVNAVPPRACSRIPMACTQGWCAGIVLLMSVAAGRRAARR